MLHSPSFFTYSSPLLEESQEKAYVLLHRRCSKWLAVNQATFEIARLLDRGESVEATVGYLVARYGVSPEAAIADILYVREELARQQFLIGDLQPLPTRSPALDSLFFHITNRCNLSCVHCYIACPINRDLPASLILRVIDEMPDQCEGVTLSGGEPLLHPEIMTILEACGHRVKLQLLTNGILIDRDWAKLLAQTVAAVQVSVDGSTSSIHDAIRGRGTFDKVMRAIGNLQEAGLAEHLTLSATIMKQNVEDLPRIIAMAEKLGVPSVRFLPLRKSGRAREQWDRIGSELKVEHSEDFYRYVFALPRSKQNSVKISCGLSGFLLKVPGDDFRDEFWCSVGKKLVVDVRGDIYPCVLMMGEEFRLGNAFEQSLVEVIQAEQMVCFCKALSDRKEKIEECAVCLWKNLCQAGCMGQALDNRGTLWSTDVFCNYRKQAYGDAFDRILQGFRSR
jgi:radical SAM protein with 4Fe4S-binding SPASM domain